MSEEQGNQRELSTETQRVKALAQRLRLPLVDPRRFKPPPELLERFKVEELQEHGLLPLARRPDGGVSVATVDPEDKPSMLLLADRIEGEIHLSISSRPLIDAAIRRLPGAEAPKAPPPPNTTVKLDPRGLAGLAQLAGQLRPDSPANAYGPILGAYFAAGLAVGASDLRVELGHRTALCMRVDGAWRDVLRMPRWSREGLAVHLGRVTGLPPGTPLKGLYGRFTSAQAGQRKVLFRVDSIDESLGLINIRIQDPARVLPVQRLGLIQACAARLRRWTAAREGLLLVVGPPDSGKTQTLLALALAVGTTRPTAALGPVATWPLPDIHTVPLGGPSNRSLEQGIDIALGLDPEPDILVIDGLKELEGTRSALELVNGGVLVIAAMEAAHAADALQRLRAAGIPDNLLGTQLLGILEQRLVPMLCSKCRTKAPTDRHLAARMGLHPDTLPKELPQRGPGCRTCFGSGYRGRRAIFTRVELERGVPPRVPPQRLAQMVDAARTTPPAVSAMPLVVAGNTGLQQVVDSLTRRHASTDEPGPPLLDVPWPEAPVDDALPEAPLDEAAEPAPEVSPDEPTAEFMPPGKAPLLELEPVAEQQSAPVARQQVDPDPDQKPAQEPQPPPAPIESADAPNLEDAGTVADAPTEATPEADKLDDRHIVLVLASDITLPAVLAKATGERDFRFIVLDELDDAQEFVRTELPTAIVLAVHEDSPQWTDWIHLLRDDLASAFLPLFVIGHDHVSAVEMLRAGADEVVPRNMGTEEIGLRFRAVIRRVT